MKIDLLFFGRPSEQLGVTQESVTLPEGVYTLGGLIAWLHLRGEVWKQELTEGRIKCAINQEFSAWDAPIKEKDEVAIFSPISGG